MKKGNSFSRVALLFGAVVAGMFWTDIAESQGIKIPIEKTCLNLRSPSRIIGTINPWNSKEISSTGSWKFLGSPETATVNECSIAGDAKSLYVFYDNWHPEDLNNNVGFTKKWTGNNWSSAGGQIIDCNGPDIAIKDSIVVLGWVQKEYQYGFSSNQGGVTDASLGHDYGTRVAIAQGHGYIAYCGDARGYNGLYVQRPFSTCGGLSGYKEGLTGSIGLYPQIAGDDSGWIAFFKGSNGFLYTYGGDCGFPHRNYNDKPFRDFYSTGSVVPQRIVLRAGIPTAIWTDVDTLYIAEWQQDSKWVMVVDGSAAGSYFGISATTVDSVLYVSYGDTKWNPRLSVFKYDGNDVTYFDGQIEDDSTSTISSVDLTTYQGNPVISFIENGTLKVKMYSTGTQVVKGKEEPSSFALFQNFPNPFNPSTVIGYRLSVNSFVTLKLYDVLGREIKTLVNELQTVGSHSVTFDAASFPSGVYFYRIDTGGSDGKRFTSIKKLVVIK